MEDGPGYGGCAVYGETMPLMGETAPIKGDGPLTPLSAVRIKAAAVIARAVDPYVLSQYEFYV